MRRLLVIMAITAVLCPVANATEITIALINNAFDQKNTVIRKGDTIIFNNLDKVMHNIQVINREGFIDDKGLQQPGVSVRQTFDLPGLYHARCAMVDKMTMLIQVSDKDDSSPHHFIQK